MRCGSRGGCGRGCWFPGKGALRIGAAGFRGAARLATAPFRAFRGNCGPGRGSCSTSGPGRQSCSSGSPGGARTSAPNGPSCNGGSCRTASAAGAQSPFGGTSLTGLNGGDQFTSLTGVSPTSLTSLTRGDSDSDFTGGDRTFQVSYLNDSDTDSEFTDTDSTSSVALLDDTGTGNTGGVDAVESASVDAGVERPMAA